jgi:hypothetical protein
MAGTWPRTMRCPALRSARILIRSGVMVSIVAFGACLDGCGAWPTDFAASDAGSDAGASARSAGSGGQVRAAWGTIVAGAARVAFGTFITGGSPVDVANQAAPQISINLGSVAQSVLYSWTTDEQLAALRSKPMLLTRSESSSGALTNLSQVISALADTGNPLAQVLTGGDFANGRYAWTNPWAMLRGWPGASQGNRLLRIELRPEAWIAVLDESDLEVVDIQTGSISTETVLAAPERIAAIFYMNHGSANPGCVGEFRSGCGTGAYRAYFLNNERMVKRWSFGTQAILDELKHSLLFVDTLRDQVANHGLVVPDTCSFTRDVFCSWQGSNSESGFESYMEASAITNASYAPPTAANLADLASALKAALFTPDPFVHEL